MNALNCINKKNTYDYFHILICFLHDIYIYILDFFNEIMSCKITILLGLIIVNWLIDFLCMNSWG